MKLIIRLKAALSQFAAFAEAMEYDPIEDLGLRIAQLERNERVALQGDAKPSPKTKL